VGATSITLILMCFNNATYSGCVHLLDNKVIDIIDARCNHEDYAVMSLNLHVRYEGML